MNLLEEKRKILNHASYDDTGVFAGKLGRLCQTIYLYNRDQPSEKDPTLGGRISKTLHATGLSEKFLSSVFLGDEVHGAGLQSIVFDRGKVVEKYLVMPLGKLAITIGLFEEYENTCLVAASSVFGDMVPGTKYIVLD